MTLAFLNPSRSFDEKRNAIGFIGHDGMSEIRFFIEIDALEKLRHPATRLSEVQSLSAFDAMRASIHEAARKIYAHHHRKLNTLTCSDVC